MSRYLVALVLAGLTFATQAQPINERWLGRWEADATTFIVTGQNVIFQDKVCRWVGKAPAGNFSGCVAFYGGALNKQNLLERFKVAENNVGILSSEPKRIAEEKKWLQQLKRQLDDISPDNFRYVAIQDADYQGSGDCGSVFIMDKAVAIRIAQCDAIGAELAIMPMQKVLAPAAVTQLNGRWFSTQWKYGYELKDGVGTATASNSAKFKVGDEIIYLKPVSNNSFEGEQVYQDGKFHPIKVSLLPDGRLQFRGEKNISWTMSRQ